MPTEVVSGFSMDVRVFVFLLILLSCSSWYTAYFDDLLKKIFESDLFKQAAEEELTKTLYTLIPPERGFKHHWFFNFETKRLENFHKDITVEVVSEYDEKSYVCRTNSTLIIVPKDFINLPLEN